MEIRISKYASYISIKEFKESMKPLKTVELGNSGVYADYDKDGNLVGIEFIGKVKVLDNSDDD